MSIDKLRRKRKVFNIFVIVTAALSIGLVTFGFYLVSSYEYNDPKQLIANALVNGGLNVFAISLIVCLVANLMYAIKIKKAHPKGSF